MKVKRRVRSIGVVILALLMILCAAICLMPRGTIAKAGGMDGGFNDFKVHNMNFNGDQITQDQRLESENYLYGYISLWTGVYTIYDSPSDTFYILVCVKAGVNSMGNSVSKRYFRNKEIDVSVTYNAVSNNVYKTVYDPQAETKGGQTVTRSITGNSESVSYSYAISKIDSDIKFTPRETPSSDTSKTIGFNFFFNHYDDGSMVSPWIGPVHERMTAVFEIPNYSTYRQYNDVLTISYNGTIFKDAKWPLKNYTYIDNITHTYRF